MRRDGHRLELSCSLLCLGEVLCPSMPHARFSMSQVSQTGYTSSLRFQLAGNTRGMLCILWFQADECCPGGLSNTFLVFTLWSLSSNNHRNHDMWYGRSA